MEDIIGGIIAVVICAILLYYLIKYVIIPLVVFLVKVLGVFALVILAIIAGYALIISLTCFIRSVYTHRNPYTSYVDNHKNRVEGIKRNYFFGPGLHQTIMIVKGSFSNLAAHRVAMYELTEDCTDNSILNTLILIAYGLEVFFTHTFGVLWICLFCGILSVVILTGSVIFFIFYSFVWLLDRAILRAKSISSRCEFDKRTVVVPAFQCPACTTPHFNLVPSPYGVLHQKCTCGAKMATTFIGGRSRYIAICPYCYRRLHSSDSAQYGLQLVGRIGAGKTFFLVAFWHEYKNWLQNEKQIAFEPVPKELFQGLEECFASGNAESTTETNANMYSILHDLGPHRSVQMTFYDIAGEVFDYGNSEVQQQQLRYCESFLLLIDPTASPDENAITIINLINSIHDMKSSNNNSFSAPVAVIISKADLFMHELGPSAVRSSFQPAPNHPDMKQAYIDYQSQLCRSFLLSRGYENVINIIEAEFSNLRYFPVSAKGHSNENGECKPWGVVEPVFWLMQDRECPLRGLWK